MYVSKNEKSKENIEALYNKFSELISPVNTYCLGSNILFSDILSL
jgi:hypothetical protein